MMLSSKLRHINVQDLDDEGDLIHLHDFMSTDVLANYPNWLGHEDFREFLNEFCRSNSEENWKPKKAKAAYDRGDYGSKKGRFLEAVLVDNCYAFLPLSPGKILGKLRSALHAKRMNHFVHDSKFVPNGSVQISVETKSYKSGETRPKRTKPPRHRAAKRRASIADVSSNDDSSKADSSQPSQQIDDSSTIVPTSVVAMMDQDNSIFDNGIDGRGVLETIVPQIKEIKDLVQIIRDGGGQNSTATSGKRNGGDNSCASKERPSKKQKLDDGNDSIVANAFAEAHEPGQPGNENNVVVKSRHTQEMTEDTVLGQLFTMWL